MTCIKRARREQIRDRMGEFAAGVTRSAVL
jgi:hypothetical protein